jgi:hypothetical protein
MATIVMEEDFTKVTLNVNSKLLKEAKHLAIDSDTTFTDLVNQALEEYIQKKRKVRK